MPDGLQAYQKIRITMTDKKEGGDTGDHSSDTNADSKKNGAAEKTPEQLEQIAKDQTGRAVKAEDDLKSANTTIEELKAKLVEKADDKGDVSDSDIKAIAEKHGVDPAFAEDLAAALGSKLSKEVKATEEKLEGAMEKKDEADNKTRLENAFKDALAAASKEYGDDVKIDADTVKDLYFTRKGANADLTVADVLETLYGEAKGSDSSEDDAGSGEEKGDSGETVDFDTLTKVGNEDKLAEVIKNPKHKKDYYAWRDSKGI